MNNIIYICLKLDEPSKSKLIQITKELFRETHPKLYCDHLTLAFGKQVKNFDMELIGQETTLSSSTIAYDDKCVALVIDPYQVIEFGVNNEHPHITMATDGMTKPVYSNELISTNPEIEELDEPITLSAIVTPISR